LKNSIEFSTLFSMGHEAMVYFHELPVAAVHKVFNEACEAGRKGVKGFFDRLLKSCEKKLKRKYDAYMIEWSVADYSNDTYESCKNDYKKYKKRKLFLSKRRKRLFLESCLQKVAAKTQRDKEKEIPLWRLSSLVREIHKKVPSKVHYYELFGFQNVHVHGTFEGQDQNGHLITHHFREGLFKGLGIVSNFKKNEGLRSPASTNSL